MLSDARRPAELYCEAGIKATSHAEPSMDSYRFTAYFEEQVLRKRPYLKREWCLRVVENPIKVEMQEDDRVRFWGSIAELDGRILRVITLADRRTIHNAFPDRGYKP